MTWGANPWSVGSIEFLAGTAPPLQNLHVEPGAHALGGYVDRYVGDDGGSTITDYIWERSVSPYTTWVTVLDPVSPRTEVRAGGLTTGTLYRLRVRAVNANGTGPANAASQVAPTQASAFVGKTPGGFLVDSMGTDARFTYVRDVAFAGSNLYVADSNVIRVVDTDGMVTTLAGSPGATGHANGTGPAASFSIVTGLAFGSDGNLYVVDTEFDGSATYIRRVTPAGVVTTLTSYVGTAGRAEFDSSGNLFIATAYLIRKVTPAGVQSVFAGSTSGFVNATGAAAKFNGAAGLAIDGSDNLFVADRSNNAIRKVTPGAVVTTFVASGTPSISQPQDVVFNAAGDLFVGQATTIRRVTPAGVVTAFAGGGTGVSGTFAGVSFTGPYQGMAFGSGDLYVGDYSGGASGNTVRRLTLAATPPSAPINLSGHLTALDTMILPGPARDAIFDGSFIWIYGAPVSSAGSPLWKIDPASLTIVATYMLPVGDGTTFPYLASDGTNIWLNAGGYDSGFNGLARFVPATGVYTAFTDSLLPPGPNGFGYGQAYAVALAGTHVYVSHLSDITYIAEHTFDGTNTRYTSETGPNQYQRPLPLVADAAGALWYPAQSDGVQTIVRWVPGGSKVHALVDFTDFMSIAPDASFGWVARSYLDYLLRIDATTGTTTTLPSIGYPMVGVPATARLWAAVDEATLNEFDTGSHAVTTHVLTDGTYTLYASVTPPYDGGSPILSYEWFVGSQTQTTTDPSLVLPGFTTGQNVRVRAVNALGPGPINGPVSAAMLGAEPTKLISVGDEIFMFVASLSGTTGFGNAGLTRTGQPA